MDFVEQDNTSAINQIYRDLGAHPPVDIFYRQKERTHLKRHVLLRGVGKFGKILLLAAPCTLLKYSGVKSAEGC